MTIIQSISNRKKRLVSKQRKPTHPGEILFHEFLEPMGMSQVELAKRMGVPIQRVNTLINEKRDVTAETAILLGRALRTSPEYWMNLQGAFDLYEAKTHLARVA
jgi:addiction module HigA family antidote